MRFHVEGDYRYDENGDPVGLPPAPGCYRAAYIRIDERTTDDPTKIPAHKGTDGHWYDEGRNHRVEGGHIKRDFDDEDWFIDIADIPALLAFLDEAGHGDIARCRHNPSEWTIDIGTDW